MRMSNTRASYTLGENYAELLGINIFKKFGKFVKGVAKKVKIVFPPNTILGKIQRRGKVGNATIQTPVGPVSVGVDPKGQMTVKSPDGTSISVAPVINTATGAPVVDGGTKPLEANLMSSPDFPKALLMGGALIAAGLFFSSTQKKKGRR